VFTVTGSDPVDCVYITLHIHCSLDLSFVQQYGTELVIKNSWYFFSLGSMQRKQGIFGGKVFHQVCVEQFGTWPLEMTYTLLMVSFLVCYSSFNIL